jgi:hypothetical protein
MTRPHGILEVLGILAAVIPCGILAGLYLATEDLRFILGSFFLGVLAVAIVFMRSPGLRLPRRRGLAGGGAGGGESDGAGGGMAGLVGRFRSSAKLAAVGGAVRRSFSLQILKLLGFVFWMLAWGVTAALYARVYDNANLGALLILVVVGGFSPVVIYFGLETGVKSLSRRNRPRD